MLSPTVYALPQYAGVLARDPTLLSSVPRSLVWSSALRVRGTILVLPWQSREHLTELDQPVV